MVVPTLVRYLKGLQELDVGPPYAVMVSLIGVRGTQLGANVNPDSWRGDDIVELTEDQFHFTEVILDSVPASNQECGVLLRPFIEQLANTAGRAASPSFGPNGEYLYLWRSDYR
jgi:hypothetical protein